MNALFGDKPKHFIVWTDDLSDELKGLGFVAWGANQRGDILGVAIDGAGAVLLAKHHKAKPGDRWLSTRNERDHWGIHRILGAQCWPKGIPLTREGRVLQDLLQRGRTQSTITVRWVDTLIRRALQAVSPAGLSESVTSCRP